jgi:hypothetical protein
VFTISIGILFQIRINASLADFADDVTVVPFHPRRAQWVNNRMKPLATVEEASPNYD